MQSGETGRTTATARQPPSALKYRERKASSGKKGKTFMLRKAAGRNVLSGREFKSGYSETQAI